MSVDIKSYQSIVFDCDGVVLNSNHVKTDAFRSVGISFGQKAVDALVRYHVLNGGISRYKKLEYFLNEIVDKKDVRSLHDLLESFGKTVELGLLNCEVAPSLSKLRALTPGATWMIVSGGDQSELRTIFQRRELSVMFDGGIYGSPEPKDVILSRLKRNKLLQLPGLYLGDSIYDYEVATGASLDFIFVSGWSEVPDWPKFVTQNGLKEIQTIGDLIPVDQRDNKACIAPDKSH
jgi:phosphoglycolate phosphatase-like HAD superfamily hydrolase